MARIWHSGYPIVGSIHFGEKNAVEAALYEAPYNYALSQVKPERLKSKTLKNRKSGGASSVRAQKCSWPSGSEFVISLLSMVAKHRFFVWLSRYVVPENVVIVFARSDDTAFGILHSRFHELWALRLGTSLEDRPATPPTTLLRDLPFPHRPDAQHSSQRLR